MPGGFFLSFIFFILANNPNLSTKPYTMKFFFISDILNFYTGKIIKYEEIWRLWENLKKYSQMHSVWCCIGVMEWEPKYQKLKISKIHIQPYLPVPRQTITRSEPGTAFLILLKSSFLHSGCSHPSTSLEVVPTYGKIIPYNCKALYVGFRMSKFKV